MKLTIPFYLHKAGAGFPSPATDYIEEDVDLNVHLIKNVPATFIIRVQGKSMTDVGIYDGDLLVIDRSLKPKNFSTVVANVHAMLAGPCSSKSLIRGRAALARDEHCDLARQLRRRRDGRVRVRPQRALRVLGDDQRRHRTRRAERRAHEALSEAPHRV